MLQKAPEASSRHQIVPVNAPVYGYVYIRCLVIYVIGLMGVVYWCFVLGGLVVVVALECGMGGNGCA